MTGKKICLQVVVMLAAFAIGGTGMYLWFTRGGVHPVPGTKEGAAKETAKGKVILYWKSSMIPGYRSEKPGKDPMGMDLTPVYEGEAEAPGTIRVDPRTLQSIGVRTARLRIGVLKKTIRTVGRLAYDEARIASVNAKIDGWIERLYVNATGQEVVKGAPLLEIYSPDLVSSQKDYLIARKYFLQMKDNPDPDVVKNARGLLDAARARLSYWDISAGQIDRLEKTGEVRKTLVLYSPFHGAVVSKAAFNGMKVDAGMELFRIADLSRIWVLADVYEYELPWIKPGVSAEITLDYLPGKKYRAVATYVYPYLEGKTRTATVRLELPNPGIVLKPDMYAHVTLEPLVGGKTVLVPSDAVIRGGVRNVVFLALGGGAFEPRDVTLGVEGEGGEVQVLSGLKGDETVVVSAQFLLDSESSLREALLKFQAPAGGAAAPPAPSGAPSGKAPEAMPPMKGMEMPAPKKGAKEKAPPKKEAMPPMKGMEGMEMSSEHPKEH
ncbi:MAG: efflux RND transporter periplasmic adaptor subunit [Deltaproteobacteria bacterium]|nr:efflux RND transporter periplasmic adaptor subunit [Deltaproteobacteria bacterium]